MTSETKKKTDKGDSFGETAERYMNAAASKAPDNIKQYVVKATPVVVAVANGVEQALPHVVTAYDKVMELKTNLAPYRLELLAPAFIGIIMCFFGGSYMTLIAAVEAYRTTGWESTYECLTHLYTDFCAIIEANKKDDAVDADGDGVADVKQISHQQLLTRKMVLFMKTIDPNRFTAALHGLQAGFLAVLATLRVQFAKAITLGSAIGGYLQPLVDKHVLPVVEPLAPPEYKKWVAPVLRYAVQSIAITIAWTLQRVISAVHSAMAGGIMAARNILEYLSVTNIYHLDHNTTYLDEIAGYGLAVLGLLFQLSMGFKLPFLLSIVLFPFSIAEWFLVWMTGTK